MQNTCKVALFFVKSATVYLHYIDLKIVKSVPLEVYGFNSGCLVPRLVGRIRRWVTLYCLSSRLLTILREYMLLESTISKCLFTIAHRNAVNLQILLGRRDHHLQVNRAVCSRYSMRAGPVHTFRVCVVTYYFHGNDFPNVECSHLLSDSFASYAKIIPQQCAAHRYRWIGTRRFSHNVGEARW